MTPTKKKVAKPEYRMDTIRRPAEIGVRSRNGRVLLSDPALNRLPLDNYAWRIYEKVVCVVPARLRFEATRIGLEVLDDATEGYLTRPIDVADHREKQMFRDGKLAGPNRQELITHWRGIVVDYSLAEAVVDCIQAGLDPMETARDLVRVYDRSFIEKRSGQQPWLARSQELILLHRAKEAGLA
jgi:hypothetical protein